MFQMEKNKFRSAFNLLELFEDWKEGPKDLLDGFDSFSLRIEILNYRMITLSPKHKYATLVPKFTPIIFKCKY
jgi:hypothetical protein